MPYRESGQESAEPGTVTIDLPSMCHGIWFDGLTDAPFLRHARIE